MVRTVPGYTRITCDPEILDGRPTVRGMRLSVQRLLEILAQYPDWERIAEDYPDLERADIPEVLRFGDEVRVRRLPLRK